MFSFRTLTYPLTSRCNFYSLFSTWAQVLCMTMWVPGSSFWRLFSTALNSLILLRWRSAISRPVRLILSSIFLIRVLSCSLRSWVLELVLCFRRRGSSWSFCGAQQYQCFCFSWQVRTVWSSPPPSFSTGKVLALDYAWHSPYLWCPRWLWTIVGGPV